MNISAFKAQRDEQLKPVGAYRVVSVSNQSDRKDVDVEMPTPQHPAQDPVERI